MYFFVPLDAAGHRTTINGFAYYDTISVEELRHYAMDAGADADSVESITDPKVVYHMKQQESMSNSLISISILFTLLSLLLISCNGES